MEALAVACSTALKRYASDCGHRVLLVTGDVVNNATGKDFSLALALLKTFYDTGGFSGLVVIPGNHDRYRYNGSFWYRKARFERFREDLYKSLKRYRSRRPNQYFDRDSAVSILGIDSTRAAAKLGGANGKVSVSEFKKLYDYYKLARRRLQPPGTLRIVAIHHHPLPTAAGDREYIEHKWLGWIRAEPFLRMEGAGRFLWACQDLDIDLILHGHKHLQALLQFSSFDRDPGSRGSGQWRQTGIAAAPSATIQGSSDQVGFNLVVRRFGAPFAELRQISFSASKPTEVRSVSDLSETPPTIAIGTAQHDEIVATLFNSLSQMGDRSNAAAVARGRNRLLRALAVVLDREVDEHSKSTDETWDLTVLALKHAVFVTTGKQSSEFSAVLGQVMALSSTRRSRMRRSHAEGAIAVRATIQRLCDIAA